MRRICFAASQPFARGVVARDQLQRIIGGRELACTVLDVALSEQIRLSGAGPFPSLRG